MTSSRATAPIAEAQPANRNLVLALSYMLFIVLGLPDGFIGAVNPTIRAEFAIGTDDWWLIAVAGTIGYTISTSLLGKVMARFPFTSVLVVAALVRGVILLGYSIAPAWLVLVALAFFLGFFGGYVDAGLNTWFAMRFGNREMNWLHAAFGIGMTLASLLAGFLIARNLGWRAGYVFSGVVTMVLGAAVWVTRASWSIPARIQSEPGDKSTAIPLSQTLRMPAVWLLIALFALTGGMEMTAGTWASSLFSEVRGIPLDQAALWLAIYWSTFTVGRIFYGFIHTDDVVVHVLRGSMVAALVGSILLAWSPLPWVGFLGLAIIGFSIAPLIPMLTSETPLRIGRSHAENSIGVQYSGAGIGIALLPALAGIWAAHASLEVVPIVCIGIAMTMIISHEALVRISKRQA